MKMLPALALAVAAPFAIAISPVWDYDVWFQLACGKAILALRGLPDHDLFSYTAAGRPWDTQEWLSQIAFYAAYSRFGMAGLTIFKAVVSSLIFFVTFMHVTGPALRHAGGSTLDADRITGWLMAGLCVVAAYAMRWHLVERPQIFSMLFLATELLVLARGYPIWWLIILTVVWANLHGGSSLIAPGVLALWIASRFLYLKKRHEPLAMLKVPTGVFFALFGAIALNPAGPALFTYPFETMSDSMYMMNVREWTPPTFSEHPVFFLFLALSATVFALAFRVLSLASLVIPSAFALLALSARRHVPLFCVAALPPLAMGLNHLLGPGLARLRRPVAAMALASTAIAVFLLGLTAKDGEGLGFGFRRDLYPTRGIETLKEIFPSDRGPVRVFGLHQWGGYLLWSLPDTFKVFIDGRQLVYGRQLFVNYCRIIENTPQAQELLEEYRPDIFVLDYRYSSKLSRRLAGDRKLALIHWDDTCLVYIRRSLRYAKFIKANEYRAYHPARIAGPDLEANLADLDRAARRAPGHARALTMRAALLLAHGRIAAAAEVAARALEAAPDKLPVLLTASEVAFAQRDSRRARALLARAWKVDESGTSVKLAYARIEFAEAALATADRSLGEAIRTGEAWRARRGKPEPSLADAYRLRAQRMIVTGDRMGAADSLRWAGNVFYELGDLSQARARYEEGRVLAPSDMRLAHNLGTVLLDGGRYERAVSMYRRALKLAPDNVASYVGLGAALYNLGRTKEARTAWAEALRIDPNHANAAKYLGQHSR